MIAVRWTCTVACLLLAVGCTAEQGDPQQLPLSPDAVTEAPTTPRTVPVSDWPPGLELDLGEWSRSDPSGVLVDYLSGYGESMRTRAITVELLGAATYPWMQERRADISRAKDAGLTVPDVAVGYVEELRVTGPEAVARLCMWEPSVALVDASTGEAVPPVRDRWTPRDVTMALAGNADGDSQWYVISERRGSAACDREAPR